MVQMIDALNEKQPRRIVLQILCMFLILSVFSLLLFKYFGRVQAVEVENPRFVKIDYADLEKSANAIEKNYSLSDKTAENVFVLNYHVVTKNAPSDEYEISYDQFKENMFALKSQGYQTVSLQEFYLFMRGEKDLPDKSFLLTFDDGAKATYYNADPVLRALNYTAVMFVITGASLDGMQRAYYLNESELHQAQQTGRWELESHTDMSHFRLPISAEGEIGPALTNKLWLANESRLETDEEYYFRVSEDLRKEEILLEQIFIKTIIGFDFLFGVFGEQRSNYPEAHSILYNLTTQMYKLVFYQFSPAKTRYFRANYNDFESDSYVIVRLSVDSLRTPEQLLKEIEASRALDLPYTEEYKNSDRWPTISGEMSSDKDRILLLEKKDDNSNIRLAYLDGSYLWKDYTYSLQLDSSAASSVLLISRLQSSADYVTCRYGNDGVVRIIGVDKNIQTKIKEDSFSENLTSGTLLSMSVSGSNVRCL